MVTLSTLIEQTAQLSLSGFKESLLFQSEDTKYQSLSFEERLYHLFEAEINQRQDKRIKRMLTMAKLKDSSASLDQIQYLAKRKLDKSQVLSLANCEFINKFQNILLTGATGTGKSFLAQAIARRAIALGYSAKYYRVTALLEEIKMARLDGSYTKTLARISKFKLLLLDDFGVTPLKGDEINDLFEIIEERTLNGSIIITAQLPIKEWHAYLGNETIADAMMDRLIHTAHKVELKGPSMRELLANT
ncbi:MAG: IS21-like element helper ATPase IstB [Sulfurimonas sp.]|nr:IS21-like element helper ATPase IstB [Sulfurimonas sp.]MDD3506568.1 IS21-like element helper ATPase IstB [Sulfurimonas sp.]